MVALKRAVGIEGDFESRPLMFLFSGLLGEKHGLYVWKHTTLGDGDALQELVQLLVVADGQLEMARIDAGLLVVTGSVVFHDGGPINWSTGTDTLGVVALSQETMDTANRELEPSSR